MDDAGDEERGEGDKDLLIEELRRAVRARDEFVAIAAHELRNPMTPILMQVHNLAATARDPRRCRPEILAPRLETLEHAVRDFVRRATTLLDASRIAAGNVRIEPTEVDLSRLARAALDGAAVAAQMARCILNADLQEGVIGRFDRLAMEQVIENLLSNAIKFGAGKPVDLVLRSDGRTATLQVRDRGVGISASDQARIFGRFEQAIGQREHGGFGVGLWLTRQLLEAMGGDIAVESTPGEGSTFIVRLPLRDVGQRRGTAG